MGGVATFQPPDVAPPDLGADDIEHAVHELIAKVARRTGYKGAQSSAVRRLTELVDDCRSRALTQS